MQKCCTLVFIFWLQDVVVVERHGDPPGSEMKLIEKDIQPADFQCDAKLQQLKAW